MFMLYLSMEKIVFKKYDDKYREELNKWIKKEQNLGRDDFNNFVVIRGVELGDYLNFISNEMEDMKSFVVLNGKTVVGFFVMSINNKVVDVEICGVNPDFRGQGLMNKILTKLSEDLREKGIKKITLSVNNENKPGLKSFGKIAKPVDNIYKNNYTFLEM